MKIFCDRIGVSDFRYFGFIDLLVEKYGAENIYATTDYDESVYYFEHKLLHLIDLRLLNSLEGSMMNAQKYTPIDMELIGKMSIYQHIILQVLGRNKEFRDYQIRMDFYYNYLAFWNGFLDYNHIDLYFAEAVPHEFHGVLLYYLCSVKGIKTIVLSDAIVPGYGFVSDDVYSSYDSGDKYDLVENAYELLNDDFRSIIDRYMDENEDITPEYNTASANAIAEKMANKHKVGVFRRIAFSGLVFSKMLFNSHSGLNRFLYEQMMRKDYLNTMGEALVYYNKYAIEPDYTSKYIYVPLHMQPEQTTMPMAGVYENQLLYIKMLSKVIPKGCFVYVKEHPGQFQAPWAFPDYRDIRFYKELQCLDNVRIVGLGEDTYKLIKHCMCVATATGTAGFEAIFRNKQVLIFGGRVYKYAPGAFAIKTIEECKYAINIIYENFETYKTDYNLICNWLWELQQKCFYRGTVNDRNVDLLGTSERGTRVLWELIQDVMPE